MIFCVQSSKTGKSNTALEVRQEGAVVVVGRRRTKKGGSWAVGNALF